MGIIVAEETEAQRLHNVFKSHKMRNETLKPGLSVSTSCALFPVPRFRVKRIFLYPVALLKVL